MHSAVERQKKKRRDPFGPGAKGDSNVRVTESRKRWDRKQEWGRTRLRGKEGCGWKAGRCKRHRAFEV